MVYQGCSQDGSETWHQPDASLSQRFIPLEGGCDNDKNVTHYYQLLEQIVQDCNIDFTKNVGMLDETFVRFDIKNEE